MVDRRVRMRLQQSDDVFRTVFQYMDPWVVRRCRIVCSEWKFQLNEILPTLDESYRNNKQKSYTCCHDSCYLKLPYEYGLIMDHDCRIYDCPVPCHRNNNFGEVHWDITTYDMKPYKCVRCGKVFVTRKVIKKMFFLSDKDVEKATRYVSHHDYRVDLFDKHEIQWLALLKYGTVAPLYLPTKRRVFREHVLQTLMTKMPFPEPFTCESIGSSMPFRLYREGKWKIKAGELCDRYLAMYERFVRFNEEWTIPNTELFKNMQGFTVTSHGYNDRLKNSLSWFLGDSIFQNDVNYGLKQARLSILRIYQKQNLHPLSALNSYYLLLETKAMDGIDRFGNGTLTLQGLIDVIEETKLMCQRKQAITTFIHEKGILCHKFADCNAMKTYIEKDSIPKHLVFQCMRNHVMGNKDCVIV